MGIKLKLAASVAIIVTAGHAQADDFIRLAADTDKCMYKRSGWRSSKTASFPQPTTTR